MDPASQIQLRDAHLSAHRSFTTIALVFLGAVLVISLLVNVGLVWAFNTYPKTTFLWTADAKAVCEATPLDEPNISDALVSDFAARAAVEVHSYSYINWRNELSDATQTYFTALGGRRFIDAFARSNILREVQRDYYVVSAVTDGQPVIESTGIDHGRHYWAIEVPLTIAYRAAGDYKAESRVVTLRIIRVDPTPANPNGVAVDGYQSTQRTRDR